MKKLLFVGLALALFVSCNKEPGYVIKADIAGADNEIFDLFAVENNQLDTIATTTAKNQSFSMKGSVDYPRVVYLIARNSGNRVSFYIENSAIELVGSLDSLEYVEVTGSKTHDDYITLSNAIQPVGTQYNDMVNQYQIANQMMDIPKMAILERQVDSVYGVFLDMQENFVRENPASFFAPTLIASLSTYLEVETVEELVNILDPAVAATPTIVTLKEDLAKQKLVAIGQKAPDFTLNDVNGQPVSLYSKVGAKYLLVDFWAGWCGPCRQENPNVVRVYNEFNKKGFDVFGVSLDRTKEEWESAIKDDKLTWTHVSDLKYWQSEAARLYSINSIPANFLLDENGIIIARNLRGEDLYNKIKELLQ